MLSSLNTQQPKQQLVAEENDQQALLSSASQTKQLLISSSELIHSGDVVEARRILSLLSVSVSAFGDSSERLIHQFIRALSLRLNAPPPAAIVDATTGLYKSSYLTFNQITPFLRFVHLTANQAILESINDHQQIHILDLDTSHGVQWPPLLQAIADRYTVTDPPFIRITGTGTNVETLRRTGDRLETFAKALGLKFQFNPLIIPSTTNPSNYISTGFQLRPGETLAVNCIFSLHKLHDCQEVRAFLRNARALNPVVMTVGEREARHNSPVFLQRFLYALDYYTSMFESLEATLPPTSRDRLVVEQAWLGREIEDIVGIDRDNRREKHEPLEHWEAQMRGIGFQSVPLSPFALSQAKMLLRLHYPSEGYQIQMVRDSLLLGWQNNPLFSISSWQ